MHFVHLLYYQFRYLIAQDKGLEARFSLQWLRGPDYDITMELSSMETMAILARKNKLNIGELFSACENRF